MFYLLRLLKNGSTLYGTILTLAISCSSLILVAIVWSDLPVWIAICVVVTNCQILIAQYFAFDNCMISLKFLYSPFLITLFIIVFCIISIACIHAFNGIYYMNSCANIVKNQAITQVFQYLWYIYSMDFSIFVSNIKKFACKI